MARGDCESAWDVPCERSIRSKREDNDNEDSKAVVRRKGFEKDKKKSWLRPENGPLSIDQLLYEFPTCPPDAFVYIKEYMYNSNVNYILPNDKKVVHKIRLWCNKLALWSLSDYNNYYNDPKVHPYFNGYGKAFDEIYYTIDESIEITTQLLMYQFDDSTESIFHFLLDLYNIINKKIPKLNTLAVYAPPSPGKNFFFDAVAAFFINYEVLGTANRTNTFAFQESAGKRLIIWNEPNYESNHVNEMKALVGGDCCKVAVKYLGDQPIQGAPIIMLTNDNLSIFGMSAFKDRLRLYRWRTAPFLKECVKKMQ